MAIERDDRDQGVVFMKRNAAIIRKVLAGLMLAAVFMLCCSCSGNPAGGNIIDASHPSEVPSGMTKIHNITLTVASPNDSHIYSVVYPYHYFVFAADNELVKLNLDYNTQSFVSSEDMDFILDFIEDHRDYSYRTDDSVFTYELSTSYFDENENQLFAVATGYDTFPDELNEVIDTLNKLCNENILDYPGSTIEDIPSFIYEETGFTEKDYPREDILKMIDQNKFTALKKMFSDSSGVSRMMGMYYASVAEDDMKEFATTELREAAVIEDSDYAQFVNDYLDALKGLGENWQITHELSQDDVTMIHRDDHPTRGYMYIAKAEILDKLSKEKDGGVYVCYIPSGEQSERCNFVYNEDASCVLIGYTNAGVNFDDYVKTFYYLGK